MISIPTLNASTCRESFPGGINNSNNDGKITFNWNGKLVNNPSTVLATKNLTATNNYNTYCNGGVCTASDIPVPKLISRYEEHTSVNNLQVSSGTTTITQNDYKDVKVSSTAILKMSPSFSTYHFRKMNIEGEATVSLTAGDYFLEELYMTNSSKLIVEGSGTARIYVKNKMTLEGNTVINDGDSGDPSKLVIYYIATGSGAAGDNLTMTGSSNFAGYIYSGNDVTLDGNNKMQGSISAEGEVNLSGSATVTYFDAIDDTDFGNMCDSEIIDEVELVAGRVTLNDTRATPEFTHVCFDKPFSVVPAVFSIPTTANNSDRLTLRIRNVTESGFDIAQVESRESAKPGTPSGNVPQTVDFLAVVPGDYKLDAGAKMRVSSIDTKTFQSRSFGRSWETISTADLSFSSPPAIIASIQTMQNEPQADNLTGPFPISQPFLATTVSNVNNTQFRIALERAETTAGSVARNENIAYIAISSGVIGQLTDDITFESFVTPNNIRGINSCHNFSLSSPNSSGNPLVIASQNTRNGSNGGWLKRCAIAPTNVGFSIVEDSDRDTDNSHVNEIAGGLALRGNFKDFTNTCSPVDTIDHYQISHGGSALTCSPALINVKACSNTNCSEVVSGDVEVTLSATSTSQTDSIWSENPITIPGGSSAGVAIDLTHTIAETVTLGIDTAALNPAVCSPDCDLPFYDSGFVFDIPAQTSCETSTDMTISAVRKDITTQQCVQGFSNVNKTLKFWTDYISPNSGTQQVSLTQNATTHVLATTEGTPVTVAFDANGEAVFNVNYADAGQLSLNASHDGTGDQAGLRMLGSDVFVNVPAKLIVESNDSNADCASNDANCTRFKAAGEKFNFSVSATCSDNRITPNFEMNNIPLTVNTIKPTLETVAPVTLGVDNINVIDTDNGKHTNSEQTISEVGVFTITATPTAEGYFNETVPVGTSTNIGRFIPDHFILTNPINGSLGGGTPFFYTGQMVSAAVTETVGQITYADENAPAFNITAKAASGSTTLNYTGNFIKLQAIDAHVDRVSPVRDSYQVGADGINRVSLTSTLNNASLVGSDGTLQYQFNYNDNYVYTRNSNAIIAPFNAAIALRINSIVDADGVSAQDFDSDATNGILTLKPLGLDIRFGRWIMENSYGPETIDLRVPMQLQYWDGSFYAVNHIDSFSSFNATDASITENNLLPAASDPIIYGSGGFIGGETNLLTVTSPGMNVRGPVTVEHLVPSWLQFDWNDDGTYNNNPYSQVNFGLYRGNDRIIYRRESFE
jgi:MSHA biogenesis protein MshQ